MIFRGWLKANWVKRNRPVPIPWPAPGELGEQKQAHEVAGSVREVTLTAGTESAVSETWLQFPTKKNVATIRVASLCVVPTHPEELRANGTCFPIGCAAKALCCVLHLARHSLAPRPTAGASTMVCVHQNLVADLLLECLVDSLEDVDGHLVPSPVSKVCLLKQIFFLFFTNRIFLCSLALDHR